MELSALETNLLATILGGVTATQNAGEARSKWIMNWTTRWHTCNTFCLGYVVFDWTVLISHWAMMTVQLHGWANGSFFLMSITALSSLLTVLSIMLLTGHPLWMTAPYWARLSVFILSCVEVSTFIGQLVSIVIGYFRGNTPLDTLSEMNSSYFLALRFANFVPSVYIFLFEGLAQTEYSIFAEDYGEWDSVNFEYPDRLQSEEEFESL